ncbi:hypothetical protein Lesp02_80580 [Lentzea sp. NBRC 105346]|uniref:DUF1349 domain-containing protein n=1 Tax=Lentzea sp. NBRC 105346 TaxID=3032205 RepID=UPI0024A4BE07|nr:DUF1349 domain-containing protein [Lentzea sp. NBRC 105346]GLZ35871.1 hypothetical protein Lesp02_80580 [Lentzea sp. NBRC 105346]
MEWFNEPRNWSTTDGTLTMAVEPGTDFWRVTGNGVITDNGHIYGQVVQGDCTITATFSASLTGRFDQAGVALRIDADNWIKTGVELIEAGPQASAVVTRGFSDWSITPIGSFSRMSIKAERRGDVVLVHYGVDGTPEVFLRKAYFPPGVPALVGFTGAAPEGPGFTATFHEMALTEPGDG